MPPMMPTVFMRLPTWRSAWTGGVARPYVSCGGIKASLDPQIFRQRFPFASHQRLGFFVHQNFVWPGTSEAFAGPFAGGIDAHFRAVIWEARGMVERIDGTKCELDVALRVDVI